MNCATYTGRTCRNVFLWGNCLSPVAPTDGYVWNWSSAAVQPQRWSCRSATQSNSLSQSMSISAMLSATESVSISVSDSETVSMSVPSLTLSNTRIRNAKHRTRSASLSVSEPTVSTSVPSLTPSNTRIRNAKHRTRSASLSVSQSASETVSMSVPSRTRSASPRFRRAPRRPRLEVSLVDVIDRLKQRRGPIFSASVSGGYLSHSLSLSTASTASLSASHSISFSGNGDTVIFPSSRTTNKVDYFHVKVSFSTPRSQRQGRPRRSRFPFPILLHGHLLTPTHQAGCEEVVLRELFAFTIDCLIFTTPSNIWTWTQSERIPRTGTDDFTHTQSTSLSRSEALQTASVSVSTDVRSLSVSLSQLQTTITSTPSATEFHTESHATASLSPSIRPIRQQSRPLCRSTAIRKTLRIR